ncbi:hypothetical protein [uncultured Fluviicola sp.]|uniref:hypothetical protein n=1 Tax=uncultured Fluviicola sp. TaxID=463303 RepID=UPI0025ED038F|nr:hypothetical protein [uncultured Fluviicola sp.]
MFWMRIQISEKIFHADATFHFFVLYSFQNAYAIALCLHETTVPSLTACRQSFSGGTSYSISVSVEQGQRWRIAINKQHLNSKKNEK